MTLALIALYVFVAVTFLWYLKKSRGRLDGYDIAIACAWFVYALFVGTCLSIQALVDYRIRRGL